MFGQVLLRIQQIVQVLTIVSLAGMYVYVYNDYLRTISANDLVAMDVGEQPSGFGVVVTDEQVTVTQSLRR